MARLINNVNAQMSDIINESAWNMPEVAESTESTDGEGE